MQNEFLINLSACTDFSATFVCSRQKSACFRVLEVLLGIGLVSVCVHRTVARGTRHLINPAISESNRQPISTSLLMTMGRDLSISA